MASDQVTKEIRCLSSVADLAMKPPSRHDFFFFLGLSSVDGGNVNGATSRREAASQSGARWSEPRILSASSFSLLGVA